VSTTKYQLVDPKIGSIIGILLEKIGILAIEKLIFKVFKDRRRIPKGLPQRSDACFMFTESTHHLMAKRILHRWG